MIKVNAHTLNHLSGDANINVIATLEDTFQSTEPGIPAQHLHFLGTGPALLNTETKRRAYRLDVVAHRLQTVISHSQ